MCFHKRSIFFFYSTVKGVMPKVGEKVLVEATFNPNMPFKWNATRVQPLPNQVRVCKYLFKEFAGGNFFSTICISHRKNIVVGLSPPKTFLYTMLARPAIESVDIGL